MYFRVLINSLGAGNRTSLNQHCNIAGLKNPPEKKKKIHRSTVKSIKSQDHVDQSQSFSSFDLGKLRK